MHTDLLVLGGGPGGYTAAFMAADLGMAVTVVDAGTHLGGTCLHRGCIPSKALLHVTTAMDQSARLARWGVVYAAPQVSLAALRARKDEVVQSLSSGLDQLATRRKVKVVQAEGRFVDAATLSLEAVGGVSGVTDHITFDRCILATGSQPIVPEPLQLATDRVMGSQRGLELADVPATLLVIGGGYIGLELGTVYAALGSQVTVVEMADRLLPEVDRDLVKPLEKRLAEQLTAIHLKTTVERLTPLEGAVEATFSGGEGPATGRFERALIAVGRRPASAGIGLEKTRVELTAEGAVVVDQRQQTADPAVLAVGDVTGPPMLAHRASRQGKVAAEVAAGRPAAFDVQAIPAVVFTDPEIAWVGLTAAEAQRQDREIRVAHYPWQASGRATAIGRTDGLTKWMIDPATDRVVGAGIVGTGAGELIAEACLAIEMGATVLDVAETIHPHPTLSETAAFAAEVDLGIATEVYRPRRR